MIDLFLLLLRPALLAAEGGSWNPLHWLALLIAFPLDVLIAHTYWAALAGWPQRGEWTISHTLERLTVQPSDNQSLYVALAHTINRYSPSGAHIKSVVM